MDAEPHSGQQGPSDTRKRPEEGTEPMQDGKPEDRKIIRDQSQHSTNQERQEYRHGDMEKRGAELFQQIDFGQKLAHTAKNRKGAGHLIGRADTGRRPEEGREGKGWVSTSRSRGAPAT